MMDRPTEYRSEKTPGTPRDRQQLVVSPRVPLVALPSVEELRPNFPRLPRIRRADPRYERLRRFRRADPRYEWLRQARIGAPTQRDHPTRRSAEETASGEPADRSRNAQHTATGQTVHHARTGVCHAGTPGQHRRGSRIM